MKKCLLTLKAGVASIFKGYWVRVRDNREDDNFLLTISMVYEAYTSITCSLCMLHVTCYVLRVTR